MASSISQEAIDELSGFLSNFADSKIDHRKQMATLSYDEAKAHFFQNMKKRRLAEETLSFYNSQLRSFEKYLILIKKMQLTN